MRLIGLIRILSHHFFVPVMLALSAPERQLSVKKRTLRQITTNGWFWPVAALR